MLMTIQAVDGGGGSNQINSLKYEQDRRRRKKTMFIATINDVYEYCSCGRAHAFTFTYCLIGICFPFT